MSEVSITLSELQVIAEENYEEAKRVADNIGISVTAKMSRTAVKEGGLLSYGANASAEFMDASDLKALRTCQAIKAWGAMLSYDIRKSSKRATAIGPKATYISMHTMMPTILAIVESAEGLSVGLRGDGGIAAFGVIILDKDSTRVDTKQAEEAVTIACDVGTAMIKAIEKVVNPVLIKGGIRGDIHLGVGIDVGEFVATNIGNRFANDLTAYGDCVNRACKSLNEGTDVVVLSRDAKEMFPTETGGKTRFNNVPGRNDAYILHYPDDYQAIK